MADLRFLSEDWPTISRRLDEALALAPEERDTWLDALHETDAIKTSLRRLLDEAAGIETGDFLGTLPRLDPGLPLMPADGSIGPTAGRTVGPYRLIRELGVGGMGAVWLAERTDGGLKRPVALKLPRLSWAHGLAERMSRERDILASLDHPNIARIHDAGLDEQGRPYLALEYVDGEPIDAYCQRLALPIAERLKLLLQVTRAVAHAHARLVVHRDLKPANILVTADGQVRLLDFGIAKLMEGELTRETELTALGGRALTLDYASPEQIRGEPIGTASDVYSLGVVAYELLAGARPYRLKRQSAAALEEAIASVDVRLASTAAADAATRRALEGDLDAILNKALKKDVAERYPTIEAFALDIERHLADVPVAARPDALGYRFRKFLRRNRLAVGAAAAVSLSLVGGLSVALMQTREALAQAERAQQVKAFMLSIFADADSDSEAGVSRTGADLLKAARLRVSSDLVARPDLAVELMTAIGTSMVGQGLMIDAAALMHEAVDLSTRHFGPHHALTCAARLVDGEAQVELGRNDAAIAALTPCIAVARAAGDLVTLNEGLRWLSTAQFNAGQVDAGVESAQGAVATLTERPRSGKMLSPREHMLTRQAYADALGQANRPGAVAAARLALDSAHEVYGSKVTSSVLDIRTMLALAQVNEGQLEAGLRELDTLVPATEGLLGPQHPRVSKIASLVGNAKLGAGDVPGAIVAFKRSLAIEDAAGGADSAFDRGMARFFLAGAFGAARRPADALPLLDEALQLLRSSAGPNSPRTLRAASAHALALAESGRLDDADAEFQTLESAPWTEPDRAAHRSRLAVLRSLQGRHADALQLAQAARETTAGIPRKDLQAGTWARLGSVQLESGDARAALASLLQAQALFKSSQASLSPDQAETLVAFGRAKLQLGEVSAAVQSLESADRFWQGFDPKNRHAGLARLYLAQAWFARGDRSAAIEALRQANALLADSAVAADRALLAAARQRVEG